MTDWMQFAAVAGLDIPVDQAERIAPVLQALEQAFRPLKEQLSADVPPAVQFFLPLP